ncbi:MAG: hypothetical protein ACFE8E_00355 [Candidatus Hodarchaeota archaeon]
MEQEAEKDSNLQVIDKSISKRESKYLLTLSQRKIFQLKILPILLIGSLIWLSGEIIFSFVFIEFEFTVIFLTIYIFAIILEGVLFLLFYFVSKANKTYLGLSIFFIFCFIAGIISLPIIMLTGFLLQVHMFLTLTVGATILVSLVAYSLRDKYFAKGYLWAHIIIFLIGLAVFEILFIIIFDIQNFLLTIPITLAYLLTASLVIMFYGAKAVQKNETKPWIFILYKVEGILLLALIIAVVIVVVILIIIVLAIICGDTNVSLGDLGIGGGSRKKKKKV